MRRACPCRETVPVEVTVPASMSHTGADRRAIKPIDRCVAPLVALCDRRGIGTAGSCCGHGGIGSLLLADARDIPVRWAEL